MQVFGDIFRELSPFILAMLILYGLGGLAMEVAQEVRKWRRPDPPKPSPEPRHYRVFLEAEDGWPLRSFKIPIEAATRLVRDLERDKPA